LSISIKGLFDPAAGKQPRCVTSPGIALAAHTGQFCKADPLSHCPECGACLDRLQLHGVADEHDLCSCLCDEVNGA